MLPCWCGAHLPKSARFQHKSEDAHTKEIEIKLIHKQFTNPLTNHPHKDADIYAKNHMKYPQHCDSGFYSETCCLPRTVYQRPGSQKLPRGSFGAIVPVDPRNNCLIIHHGPQNKFTLGVNGSRATCRYFANNLQQHHFGKQRQ